MTQPAVNSPLDRVAVLIPTYNESQNIAGIIQRVGRANPALDVVVIDDASPDGTGQIAEGLALQNPAIHVIHRPGKNGLGAAYLHGFAWALEQGFDAVVEMDADGSHQPEQLHRLLDAAQEADLVIGSRWVAGGSIVNWPWHRTALSVLGNLYIRAVLGMPVADATGGYRIFRSTTLRALDLETVDSVGYSFQVELAWRAYRRGLRIREVPIEFIERTQGQSKMSRDIALEQLQRVTRWGLTRRVEQLRRLTGQESSTPRKAL